MRRIEGAAWLLFERLVDRQADGRLGPQGWVHDLDGIRNSVAEQLHALFNTRAPLDIGSLELRQRSTIDYGIPDLSAFPRGDFAAVERLARHIETAIRVYEPRLLAPRVTVEPVTDTNGVLTVAVRGQVRTTAMMDPVWFEMAWRPDPADAVDD